MTHRFIFIALFIPLSILSAFAQTNLQRSVFFDKDKSEIKPQSETSLLEVMDFLNKNPSFQILLKGFTDADGSDEHNRTLSERRVFAVRQFLEQKGINTAKITTLALGEAQPIAENNSETGKQQNRRVEIEVTFVQSTPSVTTNVNVAKYKNDNIANLYRDLATIIQVYKVNTSRDTTLRGEKGTELFIPKNAFKGVPNGTIVDIKLKEAYSFSDIIRDNLNTMSDNQAMQTGGMVYVEANFNGQKLALKQNLQVRFNSKESRLKEMALFMGEREMNQNRRINWKPLNEDPDVKNSLTPPVTIFAQGTGNEPFRPYLVLNPKTKKPLTIKELCDTSGCYPLILDRHVKDSFATRPNMSNTCGAMAMYVQAHPQMIDKPLTEIHKATYIDAYLMYNVSEFDILKQQNGHLWDSLMVERMNIAFFTQSPAYLARKKRDDSLRIVYREMQRIQDSMNIENEKKYKELVNKNPAFVLNKMGWVNCDRLANINQSQIATININFQYLPNSEIKVISKKLKRVISPNFNETVGNTKPQFSVIKGEDLVLVAMKVENGESYLSLMEMKGQNIELTPNFKQLSPSEIKEKLKVLDN